MKTYHTDNVSLESFSMYVKLTMTQGPTKHHLLISQFSTGGTLQEKKKVFIFLASSGYFSGHMEADEHAAKHNFVNGPKQ